MCTECTILDCDTTVECERLFLWSQACLFAYLTIIRLFGYLLIRSFGHLPICKSAILLIRLFAHLDVCSVAHLLVWWYACLVVCMFAYLLVCLFAHLLKTAR